MKQFITLSILLFTVNVYGQNVGIGTTTPQSKLQVNSNTNFTENLLLLDSANNYAGAIKFKNLSGGDYWSMNGYLVQGNPAFSSFNIDNQNTSVLSLTGTGNLGIGVNTSINNKLQLNSQSGNNFIQLTNPSTGNTQTDGFLIGLQSGTTDARLINQEAGSILMGSSGNVNLTITSSGSVGIGNSSPGATLDVFRNGGTTTANFRGSQNVSHINFGTAEDTYIRGGKNTSNVYIGGASNKTIIETNLGIGNATPNAPLQFNNNQTNRKIVLFEYSNNDNEYYGFGVNSGVFRYQVPLPSDNHVFYSGSSAATSTELLRIKGNGNVGIGNSNPDAPLSFSNNLGNKISLWGDAGSNHYGMGIQGSLLQVYTPDNTADIAFGFGNSSSFTRTLTIRGNGSVTKPETGSVDLLPICVGKVNKDGTIAGGSGNFSVETNLSTGISDITVNGFYFNDTNYICIANCTNDITPGTNPNASCYPMPVSGKLRMFRFNTSNSFVNSAYMFIVYKIN